MERCSSSAEKRQSNAIVLRDLNGDIISSNANAETLTEYFERVQWAVRPIEQFPPNVPSNQNFAIDCGPIKFVEVREAVSQMKAKK